MTAGAECFTDKEGFTEMMKRNLAVFASALMLAAAVSGCGKSVTLDGTETAATLDDTTNMTLGEFNLMLRYQEIGRAHV